MNILHPARASHLPHRQSVIVKNALVTIINCTICLSAPKHLRNGLGQLTKGALARTKSILCLPSFTDIADEAGKYLAPVSGEFTKRNFDGKLLAIFAERGKLSSLPIDMPMASSQVASVSIVV